MLYPFKPGLPEHLLLFIVLQTGLALVIGTFITYRTLCVIRQRRRRSTQTTVELDDLIFLELMVNSLNFILIIVQLMSILLPVQSKLVLGNQGFSYMYSTLYVFLIAYRAIGGLGIAGIRVLCISFHTVVRGRAKRLVDCTGLGMLLLSVTSGFGASIEVFVICPQLMICMTLGYQISGSNLDAFKEEGTFMPIVAVTFSIFNTVEFICHVILFIQTRIQHKKHVQLCLQNKPKLAKLKKQRNTISSIGHFTSWFAEVLIFGSFHYIIRASGKTSESGEFYLRLLMPSINFVVFPAVQALTSHDLRAHVFSLDFLGEICYNIYCKYKPESNNVEGGDADDIELQSLGNNNAPIAMSNNSSVNEVEGGDAYDIEIQSLGNDNAPVSGSNNSSVGSLFDTRTVSCNFLHELSATNAKAPRLGNLPKADSL